MNYDQVSKKPKRILIFSFAYYPRFVGGGEVAIKEITDRVSREDIEFDLIALRIYKDLPKYERVGNVNVYRIGFSGDKKYQPDGLPWYININKYLYPFLASIKASRLHKKNKYDAIWSLMANYSGFGALFFKWFNMNVPFILTLQEGDPIEYIKKRVRFVYPVFKMIFMKANIVQAISKYLADFALDMGATCPVEVVPNGVNIKHFSQLYSLGELLNLKSYLGKSEDEIFLITTGRLVVKNAVSDVIKALEYLPSKVKFLILGIGHQETELKELASRVGVRDRVRFVGFVDHEEMPKYLKISDIFIRPSVSEGFGNSFVEAMASGLPVIATNVGGIPDFLKNKETGLFCGVGDPKDIAHKVEIYLRDKGLRDEIVDNAKKMVNERYDWDNVAGQMKEKIFSNV